MKITLLIGITLLIMIAWSIAPSWAEEPALGGARLPLILQDFSGLGSRLLEDLFEHAREVLQNYVEVEGGQRPSLQEGTQGGYLILRLYPKGKTKSDEHFTAETWFRFSNPHEKSSLFFDFKLTPSEKKSLHPDDYI
jgi:hypothetical protein